MSAMSLQLTERLFREAAGSDVRAVLARDFRVAANCTRHGWDFWRGVRSKLVQRTAPKWLHGAPDAVPSALVQQACAQLDFCQPLDLAAVDLLVSQGRTRTQAAAPVQARL
jgi:Enoyl-CoA hydratase/isomerase